MKKLIYGVGINDADYPVTCYKTGKQVICPFYDRWRGILERCYSKKLQQKHPTYVGCTVIPEWLTFSNFKAWMQTQDWEGKELDKDILLIGNKLYSPETAVFIPQYINLLGTTGQGSRNNLPLGVSFRTHRHKKPYKVSVNNGLGKVIGLGSYSKIEEAHSVWQVFKIGCIHNVINKYLCEINPNEQVISALYSRISILKQDIANKLITERI